VLLGRDDELISLPEVAEAMAAAVAFGDRLPQLLAGRARAVADSVSDYLAGGAAQGDPDPTLIRSFQDERPEFVEFERDRRLCWVGVEQCLTQFRQRCLFF
jgi:hypothetical protein